MKFKLEDARKKWHGMKTTNGFHKAVLYLCFVLVATVFWFILSLNDNVTETFSVKIRIENVPDSVTFINVPPKEFQVTLKDKGTNLVRNGVFTNPHVNFNFRDFSDGGMFVVKRQQLTAALKSAFGGNAQIASATLDSLSLHYTVGKGRRVPIIVDYDVTEAPGFVMAHNPKPEQRYVMVYSYSSDSDTITRVYTERIVKRNLKESNTVEVRIKPVAESRTIPEKVKVTIPIETLVKKEAVVPIAVKGVPAGESLLLFPDRVQVVYYTPMSLFNSDLVPVEIWVDYKQINAGGGSMIPLNMRRLTDYVENPRVMVDSVEYTLMR